MTMGRSWAHNPQEENWKEPGMLIRNLVEVVSRGGNYLLNVGPTARGTFPMEAVERLQHIGRWMKKYQSSIHGTTYTPLQGQEWGRATRRGDSVQLHIFNWPTEGQLLVDRFPGHAQKVRLFGGEMLPFVQEGGQLTITLPSVKPDPDVPVLTVEIDPQESSWSEYSAPVPTTVEPKKYIKDQAVGSFLVNAVLNGALAFCAYSFYQHFSYSEVVRDILITVFIISFLTSWIMVGAARGEYRKGNLSLHPTPSATKQGLKLPDKPILRALLIGAVSTIAWGGICLALPIYFLSPGGIGNWAYALFKTLYTGASGAIASALTVWSVLIDKNRS